MAGLEPGAELAKEINRPSEVIDDDSYVVHSFERYVSNLQVVQIPIRCSDDPDIDLKCLIAAQVLNLFFLKRA